MNNNQSSDPDKSGPLEDHEDSIYSETQQSPMEPAKEIPPSQFSKMEQEITTFWPTAAHLPKDADTLSVFDYEERLVRSNPQQKTAARRDEFRSYLKTKVASLLGEDVAQSVYRQLSSNHSFSTAQHYTALSPKTLNPTLQTSLAYFDRAEPDRQNVIVLGCSGISFNNHWYPRGHLFHALVDETILEHPFTFFGRAVDAEPVVFMDAYGEDVQKAMTKLLLHYRSEKLIKKREFNRIGQFMEEILFIPDVLSQTHYIDQISITNFHLWKKIFNQYPGHVPNFIFLSQEKIAAELITSFHLTQDTLLHKFLFDQTWHSLIYKYFDNIMCAFSLERRYGTFLFWAMSKDRKYRVQLFVKDGMLSSDDGKYRFEMTPDVIAKALANDELVPSTMLTFVVLSMYYGFFLTGGLDQPTYLTQIKQAYLKVLQDLTLDEEIQNVEPIVTDDIVFTRPTLAFLGGLRDQRVPASGLDMHLYNTQRAWPTIIEASKNVSVRELLYRIYPELYRDYCKHEGKDESILAITERDIEKHTKLDQKIPVLSELSPH